MQEVIDTFLTLAASPWAYTLLAAFLVIDGFFPFVPGESLVVALAVLSASGSGPNLWILLVVAIVATTAGDAVAFFIGRRVGTSRWAWMRRPRVTAAFAWAARGLARRPATVLLTAKFIPVARVAVTTAAGATGLPVRRYLPLAFTASTIYTAYHIVMGFLAGSWLGSKSLLAIAVAIVGTLAVGYLVDLVLRRVARSRLRASEYRDPRKPERSSYRG